jgi:hypothetical protein
LGQPSATNKIRAPEAADRFEDLRLLDPGRADGRAPGVDERQAREAAQEFVPAALEGVRAAAEQADRDTAGGRPGADLEHEVGPVDPLLTAVAEPPQPPDQGHAVRGDEVELGQRRSQGRVVAGLDEHVDVGRGDLARFAPFGPAEDPLGCLRQGHGVDPGPQDGWHGRFLPIRDGVGETTPRCCRMRAAPARVNASLQDVHT